MLIRLGREDDLVAVIALERATPDAPHWSDAEYARSVASQPGAEATDALRRCVLVATAEQEILGSAVASAIGSASSTEGEIESVVVAAHARRRRVGWALCEALLAWCQSEGARTVALEVRSKSTGAIRLYEGLGFTVSGRRVGYYKEPADDALRMHCALNGPLRGALPAGSLHV